MRRVHQPWGMNNTALAAVLAISGVLACACDRSSNLSKSGLRTPGLPTQAQPRLQTMKLWLGREELTAELALTPEQVQTGMMFRTNLPENEAMLFVFRVPHQASFWMMNTIVPLSAAYIDPQGVIQEIHDLQPHNTNAVTAASANIQYVLETTQGWFRRHNVGTGTSVRTEQGTLRETFFNGR